jgi:hypothetical protein
VKVGATEGEKDRTRQLAMRRNAENGREDIEVVEVDIDDAVKRETEGTSHSFQNEDSEVSLVFLLDFPARISFVVF